MERVNVSRCVYACSALLIFAISILIASQSQRSLYAIRKEHSKEISEALYLPHIKAVEFLSFGYRKVLANYLWFKTISYFGKHFKTDQQYQWLFHMCTLVTTLDPQAQHVYEFGSTILAWEANASQDAVTLLTRAIEHNPTFWKLPYLRGFIYYYFLSQPELAKADFVTASKLPGVHPIVIRLAAKSLFSQDDPAQAIEFLNNMLKSADEPTMKQALIERLRELHYERDLRALEEALARFQATQKKTPQKIGELAAFLTVAVPEQDPYGGTYQINSQGGTISSTSNHKRLGRKR